MKFKSANGLTAVLIVLLICSTTANAQRWGSSRNAWPYATDPLFKAHQIDSYEMALSDTGGVASVYYPNVRGNNTRAHWASANRFPVVIMLPGAQIRRQAYSFFAKEVARYGFVFVVPNNVSSVFNNTAGFSDVHLITAVQNEMRKEENDPDSPVYGIVDSSRLGLSGHSFGGVAALTAIGGTCTWPFCNEDQGFQRPPELLAAALVASHSGVIDVDTNGVPVAIIAGRDDRGFDDYQADYDKLAPPKAFIVLEGVNHTGVMDHQPPGFAESRGEPEQLVPQSISVGRFARWAGLFLRAHMYREWVANRMIYRSGGSGGVEIEAVRR